MLTHRILVLGDVAFGERSPRVRQMLSERGYEAGLEHLLPFLDAADDTVINLETPLVHADDPLAAPHPQRERPRWSDPEVVPALLQRIGVTAAGLANDHVADQGVDAALRTRHVLEAHGIRAFGIGADAAEAAAPLALHVPKKAGGGEVLLHAAFDHRDHFARDYETYASAEAPGCQPLSEDGLGDLRDGAEHSFHVAFPHWGPGYRWRSGRQGTLGKALLDAGADLVLGHGARYAQEVERRFRRWVVYGLGNGMLHSPSRYERHAEESVLPLSFWAMLEVSWSLGGRDILLRLYPARSDSQGTDYTPRGADPSEVDDLVAALRLRAGGRAVFDNPHRYVDQDDLGPHLVLRLGSWTPGRAPSRLPSINQDGSLAPAGPTDFGAYEDRGPTTIGEIASGYIATRGGASPQPDSAQSLAETLHALNRAAGEAFEEELRSVTHDGGPTPTPRFAAHVDPQYVTHPALRAVERGKLTVTRALSYKHMTVMDSEARRLGVRSPAWRLDQKAAAYRFADAIGLRRPAGAVETTPLSEVAPPPRSMVKPEKSTGARCAYFVLDDHVMHVRDGKTFPSWREAAEHAREVMTRQGRIPDRWLTEELIVGPDGLPGRDLKFYTFYGRVIAVQEIVRHPEYGRCFWSGEGEPIELGYNESNLAGEGFEEAWRAEAERVSLLIPTPCIRIDMLRSSDGVVLGEFTPRPGRFHTLTDHFDRVFGEELVLAQGRLFKDLLDGKRFDAFQDLFGRPSPS